MPETINIRKERIEKLLNELEYEITRGIMQREIEPRFYWSKQIPYNSNQVACVHLTIAPDNSLGTNNSIKVPLKLVEGDENGS